MPEICRFYGIVIFMNYNDHDPPHFHARYQDQEVSIEIQTGVVRGKMSRRALRMLFEWGGKYVFTCYERYLSRRLQVKTDI